MKQLFLLILIAITANANAQTTNKTVVPFGLENQNGNLNDGVFESGGQFQELFRSSYLQVQWQTPVQITGVAFRTDGVLPLSAVIPRVEVRFSTSSRTPEDMSVAYFENKGSDEAVVFLHDNVRLSGSARQPVSPFDLRFEFDQPFTYDPKAGNLLMYMNSAGPIGSGRQIDAHGYPNLNLSPASYVGNTGPFSDGQVAGYLPVVEFSWNVIPEPSTLVLTLCGAILLLRFSRTK